ncbi:MAG TPA: hypothetical protein VEY09_16890 [Pyrinomonadaceae bacterium]|nr:hypothetical protein [Pyrinomonadaceae bacterium]
MKDHNDIFDEFIDVDAAEEAEASPFLGDEEEEEEDGFDEFSDADDDDENAFILRTALLAKNEMLAMLSLKATDSGGHIVRFDPRESLPTMQRYDSEEDALRWFRRSLATSRKNGWNIFYDGEPLMG